MEKRIRRTCQSKQLRNQLLTTTFCGLEWDNMTEQTAFNLVKNHLLTQMTKSMGKNNFGDTQCLYRGPNGTKCAIGALITDAEYKEITDHSHEFWGNYGLMISQTEKLQSLQGLDLTFLEELQIIHDQYETQDWKNQLEVFAKKYSLQYE